MKIIDLSHKINHNTPLYPGDEAVKMNKRKSIGENGYLSYEICTGMHTGTHVDMPAHFIENSPLASAFDPAIFCGTAALLSAVGQAEIPMKREYERLVEEGGIAVIKTGWSENFYKDNYFTGHPVLSEELGDFLISMKIRILALDTPSPDLPSFKIHRRLLESGIFIVENLCNLDKLGNVTHFELFALPLAIDAEASPVRAIGRV